MVPVYAQLDPLSALKFIHHTRKIFFLVQTNVANMSGKIDWKFKTPTKILVELIFLVLHKYFVLLQLFLSSIDFDYAVYMQSQLKWIMAVVALRRIASWDMAIELKYN